MRLSECLVYVTNNTFCHYRLGITLKARGLSIERNRVKRKIRESFRFLSKRHGLLGSRDYNVVIPSSKNLSHPFPVRLGTCLSNELVLAINHHTVGYE